jgi:fatty-acyl-CoA synthase
LSPGCCEAEVGVLTLDNRADYTTLLDAHALKDGEQPAIIFVASDQEPVIVSNTHFKAAVRRYAAALRALGLRRQDLIVIAHTQNMESIYAFWGALLLGAVPAMFPTLTEKLDPEIYMRDLARLVALSGVRAVLTTDDFAPQMAPVVDCPVYSSQQIETAAAGDFADVPAPHPDAIAFLQHSSGTTGLQKGVALAHRAVLNQLASYSDTLSLTRDDVIVSWLPLYHDMGLIAGFLLPLLQGIPLVLMSPFDWVSHPALLFQAIDRFGGTLCWLPNFAYNHCARRIRAADVAGLSLKTMRAFINCSEPVQHASHTLFAERFANLGISSDHLAVSYAMAENVFAVTQTPIGQPARIDWVQRDALITQQRAKPGNPDDPSSVAQVSCGPPVPNIAVQVLDTNQKPLPERQVGEIAIRSDCLLSGYYRRDDLNPFTADGWYRTGDMGYLADGEVYIVGRAKDIIINAGKNVYPQDIEVIVNTVAGIHPGRAVVFGVADEREGTELIAVIAETNVEDTHMQRQMNRQIRQLVSQQTTVTVNFVEFVNPGWLIKTSSGKIARAANRDKWLQMRQT